MPARDDERLIDCPQCGSDTVCPVRWNDRGPRTWEVWLRCGSCGSWRHGVFADTVIYRMDADLDAHQAMIQDALDALDRERARDDLSTLRAALEADSLVPSDFRC